MTACWGRDAIAGQTTGGIGGQGPVRGDILRSELTEALIETTACMGVYRTYVRNLEIPLAAHERIEEALDQARIRRPRMSAESFAFLREILTLRNPRTCFRTSARSVWRVMRWQELTGPIVAKGLEDTRFTSITRCFR